MFQVISLIYLFSATAISAETPDLSFAGLVLGFQSEFVKPEQTLFNIAFPAINSFIIKPIHKKRTHAEYSPGLTKMFQLHLLFTQCKNGHPCEEQLYPFPVTAELQVSVGTNDPLGIQYDLRKMAFVFEGYSMVSAEGKPITLYIEVLPSKDETLVNDPKSNLLLMEYQLVITDGERVEKLKLVPRMIFG